MGTVHKFKRPPKNTGQFRGWRPPEPPKGPKRPKRRWGLFHSLAVLLGIPVAIVLGKQAISGDALASAGTPFTCTSPQVTDGDTLRCGDKRVRLQGIDAPEMPGHCREGRDCAPGDPVASNENLKRLVGFGPLECRQFETDSYGRAIARCSADGVDLSCKQIADGQAIRRYARISC